jgi:hypothetical protein
MPYAGEVHSLDYDRAALREASAWWDSWEATYNKAELDDIDKWFLAICLFERHPFA